MSKDIVERKARLERIVSQVAGVVVSLYVRKEDAFTFCYMGNNPDAFGKIVNYFKMATAQVSGVYDDEIDETYIYVEV